MEAAAYTPAVEPEERDARRKARKAQAAIADRDEAIALLRVHGLSIRRIAEVVELPHMTVDRIIRRQRGES